MPRPPIEDEFLDILVRAPRGRNGRIDPELPARVAAYWTGARTGDLTQAVHREKLAKPRSGAHGYRMSDLTAWRVRRRPVGRPQKTRTDPGLPATPDGEIVYSWKTAPVVSRWTTDDWLKYGCVPESVVLSHTPATVAHDAGTPWREAERWADYAAPVPGKPRDTAAIHKLPEDLQPAADLYGDSVELVKVTHNDDGAFCDPVRQKAARMGDGISYGATPTSYGIRPGLKPPDRPWTEDLTDRMTAATMDERSEITYQLLDAGLALPGRYAKFGWVADPWRRDAGDSCRPYRTNWKCGLPLTPRTGTGPRDSVVAPADCWLPPVPVKRAPAARRTFPFHQITNRFACTARRPWLRKT